ncbi:DNA-binding transcriptional LysR family regulator [Neobacillus niacini]|uniref:LysR family transcriptional regulator n=1 Tax=Neobacillus niacini TaxID=86668 RepID=UPI00277FDA5A|nr:LysR family transcriptional regulator [Neobacillus niacini]MDQ1002180.1 DNA-binding transcriptional LysR family regulator [Neobacillus niacini]
MDIRQLRYFITVIKEGQITRAAKKLNMTQPPLSQQLKLMEEELGTPLINRTGGKVQLTTAGKILYEKAEPILLQFDEIIEELKETADGLRGELSIGSIRSFALSKFPPLLVDFRNRFPLVTYKIWEGDPSSVCKLLENRDIELGIIRFPAKIDMKLEQVSLNVEPYVVCIPKQWEKNPVKTAVTIQEIKYIPLMLVHNNYKEGSYEKIVKEWKVRGYSPNIICECQDAAILLSLVAAGVGATIIPKSITSSYSTENIRIMEISDCSLQSETKLVWSHSHTLSKVAKRFIETLR